MFALVVVLVMSVPLTISICNDDSDAANAVDYSRWYYNQLDEPMKYAYDELQSSIAGNTTVTVDIPNSITGNLYDDYVDGKSQEVDFAIDRLWRSVHNDSPETYCTYIDYECGSAGTIVRDLKVIFTIEDEYTSEKNDAIEDFLSSLHFSGDAVEKITSIHNYVAETLNYNFDEFEEEKTTGVINWSIRSLYRALLGDHDVVCEGYARAFRAICEYNDIPCIMISDLAGIEDPKVMHMWNMVYLNGAWYTVDATWDDNYDGTIGDTYLLVGQNTVCDGLTIADSHTLQQVVGIYGFELPAPFAINAYGSDVATISFETYGGTAMAPITIEAGTVPTVTEPTWSGHEFVAWYFDSDFTDIWNGSAIYSDCCLYAKWLTVEEHTYSFEISGTYLAIIIVVILILVAAVVAVKRHR